MTIVARSELDADLDAEAIVRLQAAMKTQKTAFLSDPFPSYDERVRRIRALQTVVLKYRREMKDALHSDFGWHPEPIADLIEILGVAARGEYVIGQLEGWMAAEARPVDPVLFGSAHSAVRPQPKGVIGNMVPWNFPFDIAFGPMVEMLAAGNRVILKPSDLTPACGALIGEMMAEAFDPDLVTVALGGLQLAKAFPTLPWDHLLYTGSPEIGKSVMRAAAENLVPVTLELGGKSPTILAADSVDARSVANVLGMKMLKSGQVCVAPDHVYVPRERLSDFVELATAHLQTVTPLHSTTPDATGIIAQRHLDRLERMLAQARVEGCTVIQPETSDLGSRNGRQMPLALVLQPGPELELMREEIFGPILPVLPYDALDDVIDDINAGERPLAIYIYTSDVDLAERVIERTHSGGVCVNLAILHGALAPLPFGGSGNSGMGRHHGVEGFREFSNPRGVLVRGDQADLIDAFNPPYRTLEAIVEGAYAQVDGA